jgi:gluconokinase
MEQHIDQHIGTGGGNLLRLVVMGVSGCGKSEIGRRLAARIGYGYVEGDDYHPAANVAKMKAGIPLTDADRQGWLLVLQAKIAEAARAGRGLVLSCSALKRSYRDVLRGGDPSLAFIHLHGDRELIAARMRDRPGHFMPLSLIESQFRDLEPLMSDESGMVMDIRNQPDAIIEEIVQRLYAGAG